MISHTLYFFYNNSLLHGHENYTTLIFVVIDFDPEKIERKGVASFFGVHYTYASLIDLKRYFRKYDHYKKKKHTTWMGSVNYVGLP